MRSATQPAKPSAGLPGWCAPALVAAAVLVYANSFGVPFLLDDLGSILNNPSITNLESAFSPPPGGETVSGRPVLNATFALSYALSGLEVWGYHLLNVLIHATNGLLVYSLVARTLARVPGAPSAPRETAGEARRAAVSAPGPEEGASSGFALVAALLWTVHPLQTGAVTYIAQRAEALAAFFYLATLVAFVRATESPRPGPWRALAVTACALGMATKEVMATAPLVVLLYDRTFVGGTLRAAWAARWRLHVSLAATWIVLATLLLTGSGRGGTAAAGDASSWLYLLTQADALVRYLRLVFLPVGQVFDYGTRMAGGWGEVWWQGLIVIGLLGTTGWALVRRPAAGFLGAAFFLILAPSSSVVPVLSQTMAEHRMYLPLLAVILLVLGGLRRWFGRRGWMIAAGCLPLLAGATLARNQVYQDELRLWRDTVASHPRSDRAHNNLGAVLMQRGQDAEAAAEFEEALKIRPDYLQALGNLSVVLMRQGDTAGGMARIGELLRLRPDDYEGRVTYARLLENAGRRAEAITEWEQAVRIRPAAAEARNALGSLLLRADRGADAVVQFEAAVRLRPDEPSFLSNLGSALAVVNRWSEAEAVYQRSLALRPDSVSARVGLALVLRATGRPADALPHVREAVRLDPASAAARSLLDTLTGGR